MAFIYISGVHINISGDFRNLYKVLRGRRKYPELNPLMSESDQRVQRVVLLLVPQPQRNANTHGQSLVYLRGLGRRVGGLEGGVRSGKGMGKGEGREGNKVSKPSSPAAYQPNNHPHPPQLHFPNPTQVPSIRKRGPMLRVGQIRAPAARVSVFGSNQPPPCITRSHPPTTSNPVYPAPIGSPQSNA